MIRSTSSRHKSATAPRSLSSARVVLLNSFMGPHHWKQMQACAQRVGRLSVLLSTEMEPNRFWKPDWGDLDVHVQKNLMLTRKWRHRGQFAEDNYIHIPWDTLGKLRQLKPDVIFSCEMGMRTLLSSLYRSRHRNTRLVMIANVSEETEKHRGRLRPILRSWLRRRVDFATWNGPSCRRYLLQQGYREDQLFPFPYTHDLDKVWRGTRVFPDRPGRLFFCGSLSGRKGIVPFCEALVRWCQAHPDRQIRFVIAGEGPCRHEIEQMERPANLSLQLLGNIEADQLRENYGAADIGVFPSLADEWGLVVNESLGSGLPLLSSSLAQATEGLVEDGKNGWVFDPVDRPSMDSALDQALETPGRQLDEMSRHAVQAVRHITPEFAADCFQKIVQTALS